jgi:release factor glutamine methyltransferase
MSASLQNVLAEGTKRLAGKFANPRKEALDLLSNLVGGPLDVVLDGPASAAEVARYETALTRRLTGEPRGYVMGSVGFRTGIFEVDENVLIPRPETEGLVERVLKRSGKTREHRWTKVWELGTGSGCIATALAIEGDFERIVATDISSGALAVAKRNASGNGARGIDFRQGSFFETVRGEIFDVIVSNPPYIAPDEYRDLDSSVREFEPRLALESLEGGMFHLRTILEDAGEFLDKDGLLALEIDARRAEDAVALATSFGWKDVTLEDDVFGRSRFLLAAKGPRK